MDVARGLGDKATKNSGIRFPFVGECGAVFGIAGCGSGVTEGMLYRCVEEEIPVSVLNGGCCGVRVVTSHGSCGVTYTATWRVARSVGNVGTKCP